MNNDNTRVYKMSFAKVYSLYIAKVERKGRTKEDVDQVIYRLTWYDKKGLQKILNDHTNLENFFTQAPLFNPRSDKITWVICGYRIEDIQDPIMKKVRYLDKLVDDIAKWKPMDKILRG